MSWLKENYEKAALGGAAVILVGIVATSFLGGDKKPSAKALPVKVNNDPGTELLAEMTAVLNARQNPAGIRPKTVDGREVDLFVGQTLYVADGSSEPVDLWQAENAHKGIANKWWRKYDIDPSFVNSPERDEDKDGFTNREEYDAQTHPADKTSYPAPLVKIVGESVDVFKMQMRWSSFDAESITLTYRDNKRMEFRERVQHGAAFFVKEGDANKRFILADSAIKKVEPVSGREQEAYEVEDISPRFKGTAKQSFTLFRKGSKASGFNEIQDRSVTLTLHALGQEGSSFEVKEFEKFSLPYNPKAKNRPYQVTKIEPVVGQVGVFAVEIVGDFKGKNESVTLTVRKN